MITLKQARDITNRVIQAQLDRFITVEVPKIEESIRVSAAKGLSQVVYTMNTTQREIVDKCLEHLSCVLPGFNISLAGSDREICIGWKGPEE